MHFPFDIQHSSRHNSLRQPHDAAGKPLKSFRLAVIVLFSCVPVLAQGLPPQESMPGMAGHADCKAYFGVMWLDGVPEGQTQQASHYGLNQQQSEWWKSEGYRKARGLCYLPQVRELEGRVDVQCPGCAADWAGHFRWVVFEHVDAKSKRANIGGRIVTGPIASAGPAGNGRPAAAITASDPSNRVEREVAIVATGAAVYSANNMVQPPSAEDTQLFYHSEEQDKSSKDPGAQVARNDRIALQAAAEFIVKNVKR